MTAVQKLTHLLGGSQLVVGNGFIWMSENNRAGWYPRTILDHNLALGNTSRMTSSFSSLGQDHLEGQKALVKTESWLK